MSEMLALIVLIASALSFLMAVVVTLCVFAMVGHTEKMAKTLEKMERLMRGQ